MTADVAYLRWLCLETLVTTGMGFLLVAALVWVVGRTK